MTADLSFLDETQLDPFSPPPDDFGGLSIDDAVELIREWFFENFEDPVHNTSYDSREGGYQYIWGPYDTRDIIENVFADTASDELIAAAVRSIESGGVEWVPNIRRIQPPDEDEPYVESQQPSTVELHEEMLTRLEALETAIAVLPSTPASVGIGHNHPPEPIEDEPLMPAEVEDLRKAVAVLKTQPPTPTKPPQEAEKAARVLAAIGNKLSKFLVTKGDLFVTEMVKAAGSEAGKLLVKLPIWAAVLSALSAASTAVSAWLHSILPF